MTLAQMKAQYKVAKQEYYNGTSAMTDAEFDLLEDHIKKLDPTWTEIEKTGVQVSNKKTEVDLLEPMPSLAKMYPEAIEKFYKKRKAVKSWLWMDKLDGTSLQLVYTNCKPTRLITRGDGLRGGDISFFIRHLVKLKVIPAKITSKEQTVLRIEGLMQKQLFARHWADKYDNIRNTVNGLFNRKDMHDALKHVDLVVLGVYNYTLPEGLKLAKKWSFKVVQNNLITENLDHTEWLAARKEKGEYELDGIVIAPADWIMNYENADKPKQLVAFKNNNEEDAAQVKVKRIIYQTSGFGRIVPKVEIEPTKIDGVVIKHCTIHNAQWMLDRQIGPGAIVKLVRSGGVIPKIVGVVKKGKIQLPEVPHKLVGVNFIALENSKEQDIRIIDRFLTTLGIEFIARKTIATLYEEGLLDPTDYILAVYQHDTDLHEAFVARGFGPVQSKKMATELRRVLCSEISLKQLMVASSCFDVGVGERKLSALEAAGISMNELCGYSTKLSGKELEDKLLSTKGFAENTVSLILEGVEEFRNWFKSVDKYLTVNGNLPKPKKAKKVLDNKLAGVVATFTGYRDQAQSALIESLGGVVGNYSTKTNVLLYREGGRKSSKIEKAGDKAMTWTEFCSKFGVK